MLDLRLARAVPRSATVVALAVAKRTDAETADAEPDETDDPDVFGTFLGTPPRGVDADELAAFIREVEHKGKAGSVQTWVRPLQPVSRLLLAGVGAGDEAGWRSAGAALTRKAKGEERLTLLLPPGCGEAELRGLAEGLW